MKLLNAIKLLTTVWNRRYKMKSYCLKCRKDTQNINQALVMVKQWHYQNMQNVIVKNQCLLKIKKQKDY